MFGNNSITEAAQIRAAVEEEERKLLRDYTDAVIAERDWMRGSGTIGNETALETAKRVAGESPFTLANIADFAQVKIASDIAEAELVEQVAMETWFRRHNNKLFERVESTVARVFTDWGHPDPSRELVGKVVEKMVDIGQLAIVTKIGSSQRGQKGG